MFSNVLLEIALTENMGVAHAMPAEGSEFLPT
jgi:hypothetical protein